MAIWLPQMGGGKKIRDADALPEDVRLGRVFYNNEGRQVGTLGSVQSYIISADPNEDKNKQASIGANLLYIFYYNDVRPSIYTNNFKTTYYEKSELFAYDKIVSIEIDGIERELGIGKSRNATSIEVRNKQNNVFFEMTFHGEKIYYRFISDANTCKINYIKY